MTRKLLELIGGFMARIGKVENIILLLGVKHQGILIASVESLSKLLHDFFIAKMCVFLTAFQLIVFVDKFFSKDNQCTIQIFFF